MSLARTIGLAAMVAAIAAAPRDARAQAATATGSSPVVDPQHQPVLGEVEPTLHWHYPHFGIANYALTGASLAVAIGSSVAPVAPWRWSGATGLDETVRDSIGLQAFNARRTAADVSDVLLAGTLTFPFLFDALTTAWSRRGSGTVAQQMMAIDLETLAVAGAVTSLTSSLVSRERPYATNNLCETQLGPTHRDCQLEFRFRYRSFFSGHTSLSFTAASLVCMHHLNLHLYGGSGDTAACVAAMTAASATGTLRVMADVHYATDVLAGAAMGTLIGLGVPWLFHYRHKTPHTHGALAPNVSIVPNPTGVSLVGTF